MGFISEKYVKGVRKLKKKKSKYAILNFSEDGVD